MFRFKTDENLPVEAAELLRQSGHDAQTVHEERLGGSPDEKILSVCLQENRILLTLDMDFADLRRYRPEACHGIMVLRLKRQDKLSLLAVLERVVGVLDRESPVGKLWIIDERKIRIRD